MPGGEAQLLSDRELEESLWDMVKADGGVDTEELRMVCRHGIVHLEGALPSQAEHQVLVGLIKDVAGVEEVVDRLQIQQLLWESPDRAPAGGPSGERPPGTEPEAGTENLIESLEEGVAYAPPGGPIPEEE